MQFPGLTRESVPAGGPFRRHTQPAHEPAQVALHHVALVLRLGESVRLAGVDHVLDGNLAIGQRPVDLVVVIDIERADLQQRGVWILATPVRGEWRL